MFHVITNDCTPVDASPFDTAEEAATWIYNHSDGRRDLNWAHVLTDAEMDTMEAAIRGEG